MQLTRFSQRTRRGLARRTIGARLEARVTEAALTATGDVQLLAVACDLADRLRGLCVRNPRSEWNVDRAIATGATAAVASAAFGAILGTESPRLAEVGQGIEPIATDQKNASAVAAVAAVGPTARDKFFTAKAHATGAAIAGVDAYRRFVNKFHELKVSPSTA